MGAEDAHHLATAYKADRIVDALDAVGELAAHRPVADPVVWVEAAVAQRWDLSGLLARRRATDRQLACLEADQHERERARDAYPAWRAIADRWGGAISAALDDRQLARAIDAVTEPVPGMGRRSVPVVRAELVAWAVDVHHRHPEVALPHALTADLDAGAEPTRPCLWPLPEPPPSDVDPDQTSLLTDRIALAIDHPHELAEEVGPVLERATPHHRVDAAPGLQP